MLDFIKTGLSSEPYAQPQCGTTFMIWAQRAPACLGFRALRGLIRGAGSARRFLTAAAAAGLLPYVISSIICFFLFSSWIHATTYHRSVYICSTGTSIICIWCILHKICSDKHNYTWNGNVHSDMSMSMLFST